MATQDRDMSSIQLQSELAQSSGSTGVESEKPRILFIDAYDSFSNNIVDLLERRLDVSVEVVKIDENPDPDVTLSFESILGLFDAVVVGPGPGDPTHAKDIGLMSRIWQLKDADLLPVLGICLGFQSLAYAHGAAIERLNLPCHGILSELCHNTTSIFEDLDEVRVIRYHSLQVNIGHSIQGSEQSVRHPTDLWKSTTKCPLLRPLAWDLEDKENGAVLMALEHTEKPFWGLQYHPESICTESSSLQVIHNWWSAAQQWNHLHRPRDRATLLPKANLIDVRRCWHQDRPTLLEKIRSCKTSSPHDPSKRLSRRPFGPHSPTTTGEDPCLQAIILQSGEITPVLLVEALGLTEHANFILYDTAAAREATGRYSIIGLLTPGRTTTIRYAAGSNVVKTWLHEDEEISRTDDLSDYNGDIWQYLAQFLEEKRLTHGNSDSPFWGGFMGFVPYEVGLHSINVSPPLSGPKDAQADQKSQDLLFAFVERTIVFDHVTKDVHIQTILPQDDQFLPRMIVLIKWLQERRLFEQFTTHQAAILGQYTLDAQVTAPDETKYCEKIRRCQDLIRAGESYELCLTAQTTIRMPKKRFDDISWLLYKRLRRRNPAPFGAFLRLGPATILSSSPERFLSWNRKGACQMRPIKGTVQVSPGMTQQLAEEILHEPKERAENLMILDLIRHDLHGILGTGNVEVTGLMSVERYRTVWQLVSVIEGRFPSSKRRKSLTSKHTPEKEPKNAAGLRKNVTGLDILKGSLPPGSMTGAPKKRSCELLKSLEDNQTRGIYSGVMGYMCVGGGGDFSVVIRSAFKWEDGKQGRTTATPAWIVRPDEGSPHTPWDVQFDSPYPRYYQQRQFHAANSLHPLGFDVWHIGAGGAITALSNEKDELQEMKAKLQSTLAAFDLPGLSRAPLPPHMSNNAPRTYNPVLPNEGSNGMHLYVWPGDAEFLWNLYSRGPRDRPRDIDLTRQQFMAVASVPAFNFPALRERIHVAEVAAIARGRRTVMMDRETMTTGGEGVSDGETISEDATNDRRIRIQRSFSAMIEMLPPERRPDTQGQNNTTAVGGVVDIDHDDTTAGADTID